MRCALLKGTDRNLSCVTVNDFFFFFVSYLRDLSLDCLWVHVSVHHSQGFAHIVHTELRSEQVSTLLLHHHHQAQVAQKDQTKLIENERECTHTVRYSEERKSYFNKS